MKTLLILLLLTACAQPKQESPKAQETIEIEALSHPVSISFSEDLVLMTNNFIRWYNSFWVEKNQYYTEEGNLRYLAIYWDQKTNLYRAHMRLTNGFKIDPSALRSDNVFADHLKESFSSGMPIGNEDFSLVESSTIVFSNSVDLQFVGNISHNERLYIDVCSGQQYLKILYPIVYEYWELKPNIDQNTMADEDLYYIGRGASFATNYAMTSPLLPFKADYSPYGIGWKNKVPYTIYSNLKGEFYHIKFLYDDGESITKLVPDIILSNRKLFLR